MSNDHDKDQEYQKNMGKRLRKIRKENELSQDDVADALGICTKQYQRYEYGDSAISCEKLSILEESFHFDVRYIVCLLYTSIEQPHFLCGSGSVPV